MIAKSRERGVYDELVESDICAALDARPAQFDLVAAADVFVYMGALEAVFAGCAKALRPGGMFAFTAETCDANWRLTSHSRFQHSPDYVRKVAADSGFTVVAERKAPLRWEDNRPVESDLFCLRRSGTTP
jgi:predicted TPR repeat methyltransferase